MANGERHADAARDHLLEVAARNEREERERQREFQALLLDADDGDRDSEVALAALATARAALQSQHDTDPPTVSSSSPPGAPWWVRVLPARFRWVAALVAVAAVLVGLLQALAALRGVTRPEPVPHQERAHAPP